MNEVIERAVEILSPLCKKNCKIGLILGSGLGGYAEKIENKRFVEYGDLPGFPQSRVEGHKGRFVIGELFGKTVICMQGRFHYYEGYPQSQIAHSGARDEAPWHREAALDQCRGRRSISSLRRGI